MAAPDHLRPSTLPEALEALKRPGARALAGGQALLPLLLDGSEQARSLVEIGHLAELRGLDRDEEAFFVGAGTRPVDVADTPVVWTLLPAFAEMAGAMGDPQFRNRATLGGALAENHPSSCWLAAALALEARIQTDRREFLAEEWTLGAFETPLEPGEALVGLRLRIPRRAGWARIRAGSGSGSPFPLASVFAVETREGAARLGVAGGRDGAFRWRAGEAALEESGFAPDSLAGLAPRSDGMSADERADAAHRALLAGRAAALAVARALEIRSAPGL
ncbi:FAD binding domain-containing protein [Neomegalonema sp.]|uniref:FAD binding domain-containing protein n=1 Tax=Neomegalonema sp. TaxID=2039713 RepID=UPI0026033974|nr:FAD binding domain-containing protein [Neomegalonema sp.]MDD2869841.1 FAD binding domain-containing protein [Neomegalonema sp.]